LKNKKKNTVKEPLLPTLPDIGKSIAVFQGSRVSPACPYGKSIIS
jgi:hypothetical protein